VVGEQVVSVSLDAPQLSPVFTRSHPSSILGDLRGSLWAATPQCPAPGCSSILNREDFTAYEFSTVVGASSTP